MQFILKLTRDGKAKETLPLQVELGRFFFFSFFLSFSPIDDLVLSHWTSIAVWASRWKRDRVREWGPSWASLFLFSSLFKKSYASPGKWVKNSADSKNCSLELATLMTLIKEKRKENERKRDKTAFYSFFPFFLLFRLTSTLVPAQFHLQQQLHLNFLRQATNSTSSQVQWPSVARFDSFFFSVGVVH